MNCLKKIQHAKHPLMKAGQRVKYGSKVNGTKELEVKGERGRRRGGKRLERNSLLVIKTGSHETKKLVK
jgi:hypothetical protein